MENKAMARLHAKNGDILFATLSLLHNVHFGEHAESTISVFLNPPVALLLQVHYLGFP